MRHREDEYEADEDEISEGDWHYVPPRNVESHPVARFCAALIVWGFICVFTAGVSGLCVRLFKFAAWE